MALRVHSGVHNVCPHCFVPAAAVSHFVLHACGMRCQCLAYIPQSGHLTRSATRKQTCPLGTGKICLQLKHKVKQAGKAPALCLGVSAAGVADVCLIPEVPFRVDALCAHIASIFERKGHCVVCVAEGAGQDLQQVRETDTQAQA